MRKIAVVLFLAIMFVACNKEPVEMVLYEVEVGKLLDGEWDSLTGSDMDEMEMYETIHATPEDREIESLTLTGVELFLFIPDYISGEDEVFDALMRSLDEYGYCMYLSSSSPSGDDTGAYCFIKEKGIAL